MTQAENPRLIVFPHQRSPGSRPYLAFSTPEADISVSTTGGGPITDADLTLAGEIYSAAAHYLADCERLHTEPSATGKAGPPEGATSGSPRFSLISLTRGSKHMFKRLPGDEARNLVSPTEIEKGPPLKQGRALDVRRIGDLNPGWCCHQTALAVRRHRPD